MIIINNYLINDDYILKHKYKNYMNSCCFKNKSVFTTCIVVETRQPDKVGDQAKKPIKVVSLKFFKPLILKHITHLFRTSIK